MCSSGIPNKLIRVEKILSLLPRALCGASSKQQQLQPFQAQNSLRHAFFGCKITAQMPVIWQGRTLINCIAWFIWTLSSQKSCVWKGNSYKCIFNKVRRKNKANSSLHVFSKSWQYYFNAKRWFALAQAVSKTGPMYAPEVAYNEMKTEILCQVLTNITDWIIFGWIYT